MELKDKIIVITGAASGIGRAMALRFATEAPRRIICADINLIGAKETASAVRGVALQVDVGLAPEICRLIEIVENEIGPIDLFCSNAGIYTAGGVDLPDTDWQQLWDINVMAHVQAARELVPRMAARGGGYLFNTASAAGLLNQIGSAAYGVTKHAAVGLAEWLALTHGDAGIKVSVMCPQAVRTEMIRDLGTNVASIDGILEPDVLAETCLQAIREEVFLVLPHPEVLRYMRVKSENYERWIGGMRKSNRRFAGS